MNHSIYPRAFASVPPIADNFYNQPPANAPISYYQQTPADVDAARDARATGANTIAGDAMLRRSPDSAAMIDYWDQVDAITEGIGALRLAADKYLPKFADEAQNDYAFRLKTTKLTNIYRDAVEGLASKPFEQEIALTKGDGKTVPDAVEQFIEDVDGSGNNLTVFSAQTFFEGINSAIGWIFVDSPKRNPNVRTVADAKAAGIRPYWSHVLARNVLEARSEIINATETLTYARILEPGSPDCVRVFTRDPLSGGVTWELRAKGNQWIDLPDGSRTQFAVMDNGTIDIGVIPLVPFITGRREGRSWRFLPAMRDAADLQIELYQQESGLKFAKQLTAYPMLAGNGVRPEKDSDGKPMRLAVGPARVLYAPPDNNGNIGEWKYIEPQAQSLKFLADDIKETQNQLRELARQPLTSQMGITIVQAASASGKTKSAVAAWALGLKDTLENALVMTCMYLGIRPEQYDPTVNVFTEFDDISEGKDLVLTTLNTARHPQTGNPDISQETYWAELKRRGVLSAEFDADEERKRLLAELPDDNGPDMGDPDDVPADSNNPITPTTEPKQ